ncbi:MAG: sodium:solute symporter family protein [Methanotrichaceae archaeon]|jgi:SSS family solute:Na+ symporter
MDSYHLFLVFLLLFIAMLISISFLTSRKQRSVTDFWLAGRELGAGIIGLSTAASWINASALLLATGLFLLIGVGSIWIWVFPNIAALIIIAAISGRIKNIPALTQPELMEIRYDPLIRAPVAVAITIMMILFSVTDFIGFKLVLRTFFGTEPIYAILIMAVTVAFYVSLGGFRAVVWADLPKYALLAVLAVSVAALALILPIREGLSITATTIARGTDWWNPFVMGGVMGALVFQMALLPGWIAEQDPWQKIWAARDEKSAKRGLLIGAALMALIYICCFLAAIGISALYPMPGSEVEAEMLYPKLISDNVSPVLLALLTIGFLAACMSCTSTFATSGASCISRDLIQRHIKPGATMKEMLIINRALVVVMIATSAFIALRMDSIMDAAIIATVIGTTSYFFPIIGGLYWKRATKSGALAALIIGGGTQILLISYEIFWLRQSLDTISPLLTEHGVLVGLSLSAIFFVGVSLATPPTEKIRLAPFFKEVANEVFSDQSQGLQLNKNSPLYGEVMASINQKISGDRAHLNLTIDLRPVSIDSVHNTSEFNWDEYVERLKAEHTKWFTPTGNHTVYRLSQSDMMASIKIIRGDLHQIWLSAEPGLAQVERQKDELFLSYEEIGESLIEFGLSTSLAKS